MSAVKLYRERERSADNVVPFTPRERTVFHESDGSEFRFGFASGALAVAALAFFAVALAVRFGLVVIL